MDSADATCADTFYIVVPRVDEGYPVHWLGCRTLELAKGEADLQAEASGADRDVWSAVSYAGLFVGLVRVHRAIHAQVSEQ